MDDLISRQAAIDAVRHSPIIEVQPAYMLIDKGDVIKNIIMVPSAQRTGRWIDDELICKARCSVCGEEFSWMDNDMDRFWFCPNCGARMEGQE